MERTVRRRGSGKIQSEAGFDDPAQHMDGGGKIMREIMFRGKMDDGKWVYGSFCMDAREQFNGLCGVDGFIRFYDKTKGKMQT